MRRTGRVRGLWGAALGAAFCGAAAPAGSVPEEVVLANLAPGLELEEEEELGLGYRHGAADMDLDGTGRKDHRVVYYTNGSSGVARVFRREGEGYRLVWQYPEGDGPTLDSVGSTTVDDVDLEGDARREIHLAGSNGRSEVHYLFRWDGAQGHMVSPKADKYPGGRTVGSAFSGRWIVFADLNRDGLLDAVVTQGDYQGRAMAEGPAALIDVLYLGGREGFAQAGTRRYDREGGTGAVGFVSAFEDGEARPASWKRAWLSGGEAAQGTVEFRLSGPGSGHALSEVDPDSVRVADRIRPEAVAPTRGAVGQEYLEVRYPVGALRGCAAESWGRDGERTGQVCFAISAAVRGRQLMLTREQCLDVR